MKKIIILSDLSLNSVLICASIDTALFERFETIISFVPEKYLKELSDDVHDSDVVVGIGYRELSLRVDMLESIKNKLLFLATPNDELPVGDGKYVPVIFNEKVDDEIGAIMGTIINISNGEPLLDESIQLTTEDLAEANSIVDEEFEYLSNRYEKALKVVHSLYGTKKLVKLHERFFDEVLRQEEEKWINKMIGKFELMEEETKKLIPKIHPFSGKVGFGILKADTNLFFENDIFEAAEKLGFCTAAIEYPLKNGEYQTIFAEKCAENMYYLKGKVSDNFKDIIASLN